MKLITHNGLVLRDTREHFSSIFGDILNSKITKEKHRDANNNIT
jgi:hypothetical protein